MTSTSSEHGWADLMRPEIYADLQAAGSLAAALGQVAADSGLDVGEVHPNPNNRLLFADLGGASRFQRKPVGVVSAASKRCFILSGWSQGTELIRGGTSDLQEIARAAASWRSGAALADIQHAFPWIEVDESAFAHERGPADEVTVQWSRVRAQMREPMGDRQFDIGIRLVEAAYAEPRLRQLFPYTSHWVLGFSRCTGYPFTRDVPWIGYARSEDRYQVRTPGWSGDHRVLGEPATAEEAVALVVEKLPEGTGPAVAGTSDEL